MEFTLDTPYNTKRFQTAYGLKADGIVGPKTTKAFGTTKGVSIANKLVDLPTIPAVLPSERPATQASPIVAPIQESSSTPVVAPVVNTQTNNTVQPQYTGKDIYTSSGLAAMSPEEQQAFGESGGTIGVNGQMVPGVDTKGMFDSIGGMKGFSDGASGLASLYGVYSDMQKNKRADQVLGMQKDAVNSQYASNADWNKNIASSGLGLASRAVRPA